MKKLFSAIIAALCLVSCVTSETDCIYTITRSTTKCETSFHGDGEAKELIESFLNATNTFDKNNKSDWEWIVTVSGGNYKKGDAAALNEFDRYSEQLQRIYDDYEKKFDACTDETSSLNQNSVLRLSRWTPDDGDKELASKSFSIKLNY